MGPEPQTHSRTHCATRPSPVHAPVGGNSWDPQSTCAFHSEALRPINSHRSAAEERDGGGVRAWGPRRSAKGVDSWCRPGGRLKARRSPRAHRLLFFVVACGCGHHNKFTFHIRPGISLSLCCRCFPLSLSFSLNY